MRCLRCSRKVEPTVHTNRETRVDGYRLHTGKVKLVEAKDNANGPPTYLQLFDPQEFALCVDCFGRTEIREVWLHKYLAVEQIESLKN